MTAGVADVVSESKERSTGLEEKELKCKKHIQSVLVCQEGEKSSNQTQQQEPK
jgi:hypothetical protein